MAFRLTCLRFLAMTLAADSELEPEVDRLYSLPLAEFTAARDQLAKQAREEGERAVAARIKELRKPSVSAWAINQLARSNELDLKRLLKASKRLAETQLQAVSGKDPKAFLEARREETDALNSMARAARQVLERAGHGPSALDPITRTLRAGAATDEGRELLERGRLSEDLQPTGFEAFAGISPAPRATKEPSRPREKAGSRQPVVRARERVRQAKAQERSSSRQADAAEREAEQAERRAAELREIAEAARADADAARVAVAEAEAQLARESKT